MKFFRLRNVYMEGVGDDGAGGGGGGGGGGDDSNKINEAVTKATEALNSKNKQLLDELKSFKEKAKQFDGLDLDKLQSLQKHMDESEEARLIADGKFDDVFDRRFARVREDNDARYGALETKYKETEEKAGKYESLYAKERIRNQAIRSAEKSGVDGNAIDDVVDKVLAKFTIGDNGQLEARDEKNGSLIMSKDGKTVLQPEEFINDTIKTRHPYYWPSSRGAGFGGGGPGGDSSTGNITDQKILDAAKSKNLNDFRQLRKKQQGS